MTSNLFAYRAFYKQFSVGRSVIAFVVALVVALGAAATPTLAKDDAKKTKAVAKAHKPWIKLCPKSPKGKPKLCVTRADYLDRANMLPYAPVAIEEIEGKGASIIVTLPHVWIVPVTREDKKTKKKIKGAARVGARWGILSGVIVKIDENKIHKLKFVYCDQFGCVAQTKATKALLNEMKKGKRIFVAGKNGPKTLGLPFTLDGFGTALAGKASDEAAYRKAWQKQMVAIRKQQVAMAKKQRAAAIAAQKKK
jgi:invasion protein IalB